MSVEYVFWAELPTADADFDSLTQLLGEVLEDNAAGFAADLRYQQGKQPVQAWLAFAEGKLVACKLGYERKPGSYYSWLGGVHPAHRGQGLAAELMRRQHAWCKAKGYHSVRTQTFNRWRAMLILNLRFGFDIIGTVQGGRGLTLVLEKQFS
ncbi:N-acetyltransferase [Hymenobacter sediminis]|uniref:GNAT family N-acetyltransferase n=1 Tax=Hymenobacter sediminis TaxID=2218621 RepID=UPI000DA67866|nr:GNAT family N-acetyltransferase [Hymenobacter sediminis]RPD46936.1 N-acetyltransferase [Hymenobacter sediminis]